MNFSKENIASIIFLSYDNAEETFLAYNYDNCTGRIDRINAYTKKE